MIQKVKYYLSITAFHGIHVSIKELSSIGVAAVTFSVTVKELDQKKLNYDKMYKEIRQANSLHSGRLSTSLAKYCKMQQYKDRGGIQKVDGLGSEQQASVIWGTRV